MSKPINKEYLAKQLFSFDEQILENKYINKEELEEKYTHDNKDVLDKLSETSDGQLFFNGNEISNNVSIDIDEVMSDISTNPVQNKVIKDYVDNKAVTVSTVSDNAIETKTDGIYVKKTKISTDTDNALSEKSNGLYVKDLSSEFAKISYAQKTVNSELDYCYIYNSVQKSTSSASANQNIISLFDDCLSNMEIDSDGYIKLIAGKRYAIFTGILTKVTVTAYVRDKDGNIHSNRGYIDPSNKYSNVTPCTIINTTEDMYIGVSADADFTFWTDCSYISVVEIGKAITIDPLDYVNETQGIEDAPVGHIIAHMGTTAPKHYLVCDGSSVIVADYPYLAQHFRDSFGSEYYFGGSDGMMNLPDLRGEFLRGTGTNGHENQGNGGEVGEHQDATNHINIAGSNYITTYSYGVDNGALLVNKDSEGDKKNYSKYATTSKGGDQGVSTYTSRPTNTSVLYCIKYEPTYFMQNTYNGNVYSTDEQIVGRWIDGKPIYQKTFQFDTLPVATKFTDIEELPNVDTTVDIKHIYSIGNGNIQCTDGIIANANGDEYRLQFAYDNGHLTYYAGEKLTGSEALKNIYVTVQYTKTTNQL